MRILLDTHIFLWFISADSRLSIVARDAIRNLNNEVFLSVVSAWEMIVKFQLGKLSLPESPDIYVPKICNQYQIVSLGLSEDCVWRLKNLPNIHRDPFDRMLICSAIQHNMVIVTDDFFIKQYSVRTI